MGGGGITRFDSPTVRRAIYPAPWTPTTWAAASGRVLFVRPPIAWLAHPLWPRPWSVLSLSR